MIEVSDGEEFEPCRAVGFDTVDQFERCSKATTESSWYLIDHDGCVPDGKEPKLATNLFFCYIGTSHTNDGLPGSFNETI